MYDTGRFKFYDGPEHEASCCADANSRVRGVEGWGTAKREAHFRSGIKFESSCKMHVSVNETSTSWREDQLNVSATTSLLCKIPPDETNDGAH